MVTTAPDPTTSPPTVAAPTAFYLPGRGGPLFVRAGVPVGAGAGGAGSAERGRRRAAGSGV